MLARALYVMGPLGYHWFKGRIRPFWLRLWSGCGGVVWLGWCGLTPGARRRALRGVLPAVWRLAVPPKSSTPGPTARTEQQWSSLSLPASLEEHSSNETEAKQLETKREVPKPCTVSQALGGSSREYSSLGECERM